MKAELKRTIKENNLEYPITMQYFVKDAGYLNEGNIIYNLITKDRYWHKPTYNTLNKALDDLVWYCKQDNRKYLAMPKIGCGLDRLSWDRVKAMIENKFKDLDIKIVVRYI